MDKKKKAEVRKLRKKAIKMQNSSSAKLSMAEALSRVQAEASNPQ